MKKGRYFRRWMLLVSSRLWNSESSLVTLRIHVWNLSIICNKACIDWAMPHSVKQVLYSRFLAGPGGVSKDCWNALPHCNVAFILSLFLNNGWTFHVQAYDQHLNMILGDVEEIVTTVEIDDETYEEIVRVWFFFSFFILFLIGGRNYVLTRTGLKDIGYRVH